MVELIIIIACGLVFSAAIWLVDRWRSKAADQERRSREELHLIAWQDEVFAKTMRGLADGNLWVGDIIAPPAHCLDLAVTAGARRLLSVMRAKGNDGK